MALSDLIARFGVSKTTADKWLLWAAKLGILRYGAKRYTYTSGRDRPAESLFPGVFNAERDLTTGAEIRALFKGKDKAADPAAAQPDAKAEPKPPEAPRS